MIDYIQQTNHAVHPSEILKDIIEDREITQKNLATKLGISLKHMSELVSGQVSFTTSMALKLAFVLDTPADTWLQLQANYDMIRSRLAIKTQIDQQYESEKDLLSEFTECYSNLQAWDLVPKTLVRKDRYTNILDFFAIPSLQLLSNNYQLAKFRKGANEPDSRSVAGWLRYGEKQFDELSLKDPFNISKFKQSLEAIKGLTNMPISKASRELVRICAEAGVVVVFTPYFTKTHINGSTRWIVPSRPLIQLSERNKRSDALWFTFFHEAAHIILHSKKQSYINWDSVEEETNLLEERAADEYAKNFMIPLAKYEAFLSSNSFNFQDIIMFSRSLNIGSDIVAGRLAYENKIGWPVANQFFKRIKLEKD